MAVTNLNGELQEAAHSTDSHGSEASAMPPQFKGKGTRSAPDHSRRHSLPLHFLPPNLWSANTSRASLIESEEAARGEHILDEATVAHRISALRQLNGATRTKHQYAKSTGARNSTFSQPVIVRTYSGTRPQSRQRELPVKKEVQTMGKAELPPVEAFSFKGIMESIQSGVTEDLERIAEICARSRYSLSNQYEVHMPPHGQGDPFLRTPGHAALQTVSGPVSGPTLQAIGSDDEQTRPPRRSGRPRTKSMAYGTLETIMSSSRSSEEDKERKKSAAVIADEVRGRAVRKAASIADDLNGTADDEREPRRTNVRSRSTTFASLMIDNAQGSKGETTSHMMSPTSLVSEPARPQTSLAEHDHPLMDDAATTVSVDMDPLIVAKPSLGRQGSIASALRPEVASRPSVLRSLSSWLPWSRSVDVMLGANGDRMRNISNAEGSLRDLLKATDGDRKGKGVDRSS